MEGASPTCLGMFAKYWQTGKVKTRLGEKLGMQTAATIHQAFVTTLAKRFAQVADARVIAVSPVEQLDEFRPIAAAGWQLVPQAAGDLGERMRHFFETSLQQHQRVVLIGSDSPTLPAEYLHQAFEALTNHPVVLGPAEDGGYYLIGMRTSVADIFTGIEWGEGEVLQHTLKKLQQQDCDYHLLPEWYDIDHLEDFVRLKDELKSAEDKALQQLLNSFV